MSTLNTPETIIRPAGAFGMEHLLPPDMNPNRDVCWLVSVFPGVLRSSFNYLCLLDKPTPSGKSFSGVTHYVTEPASREKPFFLPVYRALTWTIGSAFSPIDGTATIDRRLAPVFAADLAAELIRQWTTGLRVIGGETIGVVQIESPKAVTPQFLDSVWAMQQNYFRQIVDKGNEFYAKGQATHDWQHLQNLGVGSIYRIAAKSIGASVPWARDVEIRGKQCIACRKDILLDAAVCEHCGTELIQFALGEDFPYSWDQLQIIDPFVAQAPAVMRKFGQAANPSKGLKTKPGQQPGTQRIVTTDDERSVDE